MPTQPTMPFAEPPAAPPPPHDDLSDAAAPLLAREEPAQAVGDVEGERPQRQPERDSAQEPAPVQPDLLVARPAADAVAARRPWWAHLLGKLLEPWITLTIEPPVRKISIASRPDVFPSTKNDASASRGPSSSSSDRIVRPEDRRRLRDSPSSTASR